jgi:hypothetical protein
VQRDFVGLDLALALADVVLEAGGGVEGIPNRDGDTFVGMILGSGVVTAGGLPGRSNSTRNPK